MSLRPHAGLAALSMLIVALAAFSPSGAHARPSSAAQLGSGSASAHRFYVSIGDSYAAGMQPTSSTERHATRNGFAYQLANLAPGKGYALSLVNFGCGGATTSSLLHRIGCDHDHLGPGATPYDRKTQAAAAENFLRAHRGHIGLITVAIGLNDLIPCADAADTTRCVEQARTRIRTNLGTLLEGLRSAAGSAARIVGIAYPDVFLAGLLDHPGGARRFAMQSASAFQSQINPQLRKSYESVGATFVDVTKATGGYGSLTEKTTLPPYGNIPTPVARICRLTYECQFDDVHPRTKGYTLIARRILDTLPAR